MGYQGREVLADSLSAADVHVVGLAQGLAGYVVPSRLYGVLAVGPAGDRGRRGLERDGERRASRRCGVVVGPGRPELLARAIRRAYDGELDLQAMGERGREFVAAEGNSQVASAATARSCTSSSGA